MQNRKLAQTLHRKLDRRWARRIVAALGLVALGMASDSLAQEADPAEVTIGERLFLETRFAEFFARNASDVNAALAAGDPVVDTTQTTGSALPGPFAGQSINCRACHLVDEQLDAPGGGMRSYGDFTRRSPIPAREDGKTSAPRNSPPLVNASLPRRGGVILHFDGEFPSLEALVIGTLTGRNYGWRPGEAAQAIAHIARVIREDDGGGELAQEFGGAYRVVLAGTDSSLPDELRLPEEFRIDVDASDDAAIVASVAKLIAAYVEQLVFSQDEAGAFNGSPYDAFLARNGIPRAPAAFESAKAYTARLRRAVTKLRRPRFVDDGPFEFHDQQRRFGPEELAGLRVFLQEAPEHGLHPNDVARGGVGNCTACHLAPSFTDFGFHNTGVAQSEYDALHGEGSFARIEVPGLARRQRNPERWLPATARHPFALEPFRAVPSAQAPGRTDLGVWNVFANADMPDAQEKLWRALCEQELARAGISDAEKPGHQFVATLLLCNPSRLLPRTLATFKTPGLRDLSHSAPYMHNGAFPTLEATIGLYQTSAAAARRGRLRNAAPELAGIALSPRDVESLAAFLRSLNEDYN